MLTFGRYAAKRSSGLPWAPLVPDHWGIARLRYVARVCNGTTPSRDRLDYWTGGTIPWLSSGQVNDYIVRTPRERITHQALRECALRILPAGTVIVGMVGQGKTRGMAAYLAIDACINQNLAALTPGRELDGRYLHYYLTASYQHVRNFGRGGNQAALNCALIGSLAAVIPPRGEQEQIVAYLRVQDTRIGRFIKAKRELIELLNEQKQAIVQSIVTRGLERAVDPQSSSVDWLAETPAHWQICRLKHCALFNPSRTESQGKRHSGELVSFLPMECITTDGKLQNVETRSAAEVWEGYTYFRRGDVVLAKITPCFENGKGGWLDELPTEIGFGTTEFLVLRPNPSRVRPAFFARLLSLKAFRTMGADAMTGAAGQQRVPLNFVKNFTVALPPLEEQDRILHVLDTATHEQDAAIQQAGQEIKLIREYRDRLIADVVTGQVDVRGWTPGPDDLASEADLAALADDEAPTAEDDPDDADD